MADLSKQIDVENIFSYCDDLVAVLSAKKDVSNLTRCLDRSSAVKSSLTSDFEHVQSSIRDCQKKIEDCKQKTDEAMSNVVAAEDIYGLQNVLKEELYRENFLEQRQQILLIEERRRNLKKLGLDVAKSSSRLSFYSSVTNIIPNLDSCFKISGQIAKRDRNAVELFEIDPMSADPYDMCNNIWEMID